MKYCVSEEQLCAARSAASPLPMYSQEEPQMELKLNITDSQLVLVEDPSVWDTNAVILRVRNTSFPSSSLKNRIN